MIIDRAATGMRKVVLLTGASGYVGGRLMHALELRDDVELRCLARRPESVHPINEKRVKCFKGDLLEPDTLPAAFSGAHTAYFLAHALGSKSDFEQMERRGAENFANAAREAGVQRIIYLGGLAKGEKLSPHLRSRKEVGQILAASGIPTIEFRASIIIGSGSLSFELLRALTEKLPIMITPRWLNSLAQPIAIEDVLAYLKSALELTFKGQEVVEIGGPDQVAYLELIREYARARNLRRLFVPVPVLSPFLSSLWLGLVTPVYARIGRKLVDSLINDTVVTNSRANELFAIRPMNYKLAIARAILNEDQEVAETRWYDSESAVRSTNGWGGVRFGSRLVDTRSITVEASTQEAFSPIQRIGGNQGWYFADLLWRLRGFFDLLIGGVGMRRGRVHPVFLRAGEPVDFWRVEAIVPNELLRFAAEMKLPGRAWLQFEVRPKVDSVGSTTITQTAIFDPLGLWGLIYWYALYPIHCLIFAGMLKKIAERTEEKIERLDPTRVINPR